MKTIKQIFILSLLILASQIKVHSAISKLFRSDTVRIEYKSSLIEISSADLNSHTIEKTNLQEWIGKVQNALKNVTIQGTGINDQLVIRYSSLFGETDRDYSELSLETRPKTAEKMVFYDGNILLKSKGNVVLELENKNYFIRIFLDEITGISELRSNQFTEKLQEADELIPKSKKRMNCWLVLNREGSFNTFCIDETPPLTNDMLELTAGIGTGWIKNEILTDVHFRIGLGFANKGFLRNKYFAEIEALYDFSDNGKFVNNGFLSLGYERNFSNEPGKDKWYGLSVGYLFDRNNDFFEKTTFKLAVNKRLNNSFSVKPEIYFNDFFKNVYPGLRLCVSF